MLEITIRKTKEKTYFTCLDVYGVDVAYELKKRNIPFKLHSADYIPNGAPQCVKIGPNTHWDDVCCFESYANVDDLNDLLMKIRNPEYESHSIFVEYEEGEEAN